MTDQLRAAAEAAIEVLEEVPYISNKDDYLRLTQTINALRAALAKQDSPSDKSDIVVGGIVQVRPDIETFGACMVTVTEVKNWGVMGYVQSAGVNGQQYIRLKTEDIQPTGGVAVWIVGGNDD